MNNPNDNFSTPLQTKTRRLGLRRSNGSSVTQSRRNETPASGSNSNAGLGSSDSALLPHSDAKVNYRSLGRRPEPHFGQNSTSSPTTPGTPVTSAGQRRQALSTNCRPYRMALSKRVRDKMSKKRLQFHMANEMEYAEGSDLNPSLEKPACNKTALKVSTTQPQRNSATHDESKSPHLPIQNATNLPFDLSVNPEDLPYEELQERIALLRKSLHERQQHEKKVLELRQAIGVWQTGFSQALDDLQAQIQPRMDKETLLMRLHIPQEMLQYIND